MDFLGAYFAGQANIFPIWHVKNLHSICFLSLVFARILALFLRQKRRNRGVKFAINNVRYIKYKSQKPREKDVPAEFQGGTK